MIPIIASSMQVCSELIPRLQRELYASLHTSLHDTAQDGIDLLERVLERLQGELKEMAI